MATALLVTLTACGGDDPSDDTKANSTEADVETAAREQADRFSSGDYAGAWDMWADSAKDVMSEADYVTYAETCATSGAPLDVDSVRLDGDKNATVRLALGEFTYSYKMVLEDGDWSWIPNDDALTMYEKGAAGAIAAAKEAGSCASS